MSSFSSLLLAIDLANVKRDQAMGHWHKAMQAQAYAMDQMRQLKQYASETEERWTCSAQQSTTPELLHHHYQFMDRLNQTMALQDNVLETSSQKVETARQLMVEAEVRLASLKKLVALKQAEQQKQHRHRDQKHMDECAAMQTQRQMRINEENAA